VEFGEAPVRQRKSRQPIRPAKISEGLGRRRALIVAPAEDLAARRRREFAQRSGGFLTGEQIRFKSEREN
jgi:hypothetical protein